MLENNFKQPCLFSLTVDALSPTNPIGDQSHWRLPAYDPKNEKKYLYKIHSLDLYLWTVNDSAAFLEAAKRVMPDQQLRLVEPPAPAEHHDSMSPVVQQLEQAAIETPYRPRADTAQSGAAVSSVASSHESPAPSLPVPVAYNPAAPAAPEPIAHREKTPPPEENTTASPFGPGSAQPGTQYAARPAPSQQGSYQPATPQQGYFPSPSQRNASGSFAPPPPHVSTPANGAHGSSNANSFPPPPPGASPTQALQQGFTPQTSQTPYQPLTQYASYPQHQQISYSQSPGLAQHTPLQSPGYPNIPSTGPPGYQQQPLQSPGFAQHNALQSPGFGSRPQVQSPGIPPPPPGAPPAAEPVGGYSGYNYTHQPQPIPQSDTYSMHSQLYRPTESEAAHGHGAPSNPTPPDKFNARFSRVEKGVGRFLKKLDQKI